jgi:hypothetical protein
MFKRLAIIMMLPLILAFSVSVYADDEVEITPVFEEDAAFAVEWMTLLYDRIWAHGVDAPAASRLYGYAAVSLYESLVNGMPDNVSLIGQIYHMPDLSFPPDDQTMDYVSVANSTLALVFQGILPTTKNDAKAKETVAEIKALYEKYYEQRVEVVGEDIVTASAVYGETLAEELLEWIADDNYAQVVKDSPNYELLVGDDYLWEKTNPDLPIVEPYWGQIRPLVLDYADQCAVWSPQLPFSTDDDSVFYKQALEVMTTGQNLTPEQQEIARFWIDTPGESGTPSGHWVMLVSQLIEQQGLSLGRAAEAFAMNGISVMDSFISAWSLKYQTVLLRPVTYINRYINRRWRSFLETPNFPEYPSGHSVVSAAAAEVLTDYFGIVAFLDSSPTRLGIGLSPRAFTSIEAAASEAAISRLYGGIHYRTGIENGMKQGRCIGEVITNRIRLRPVAQGE